eukprot:669882-Rhodomonas_salina.1
MSCQRSRPLTSPSLSFSCLSSSLAVGAADERGGVGGRGRRKRGGLCGPAPAQEAAQAREEQGPPPPAGIERRERREGREGGGLGVVCAAGRESAQQSRQRKKCHLEALELRVAQVPISYPTALPACYAMPRTDLHRLSRCPVLRSGVGSYAKCGLEGERAALQQTLHSLTVENQSLKAHIHTRPAAAQVRLYPDSGGRRPVYRATRSPPASAPAALLAAPAAAQVKEAKKEEEAAAKEEEERGDEEGAEMLLAAAMSGAVAEEQEEEEDAQEEEEEEQQKEEEDKDASPLAQLAVAATLTA